MTKPNPAVGLALTDLVLLTFRVNNLVLAWGDRLSAPYGLTSARWQVLGAIVAAERPQPVAWIARDLGASRQNIQRIVNDLAKAGLVAFQPNPHHKRAQLVQLTDAGRQAFASTMEVYRPAADRLADDLTPEDLKTACRVMSVLRRRFEDEAGAPG